MTTSTQRWRRSTSLRRACRMHSSSSWQLADILRTASAPPRSMPRSRRSSRVSGVPAAPGRTRTAEGRDAPAWEHRNLDTIGHPPTPQRILSKRMTGSSLLKPKASPSLRWLTLWGPGLLVMLADCDAGNVVTAAQSGAQWGAQLLLVLLALIPLLYMVQELTVRLGIFTGQGHGELVRSNFGPLWAWISAGG